MKFSSRNLETNNCWQTYKQLELISDLVPKPPTNSLGFRFGLGLAWKTLLSLLADELVEEQKVEYIKRCWAINESVQKNQSAFNQLRQLWILMS